MTKEEKAKKYDEALERAKRMFSEKELNYLFPELKESEDERIKRTILELVSIAGNGNQFEEIKDWLEKQKPIDEEELKKGALKYVARQFVKWLDAKIPNDKMCLSNMECKDIEDAFLKDDWARISHYMRKKLEKQNKTLDPDKVIEWLEGKAFQSWAEDINIKQIVDKFKKDFGL